jgi:predicted component of type VI protein secretion system
VAAQVQGGALVFPFARRLFFVVGCKNNAPRKRPPPRSQTPCQLRDQTTATTNPNQINQTIKPTQVYTVTLHGEQLRTDFRVVNTGDAPFEFTAGAR